MRVTDSGPCSLFRARCVPVFPLSGLGLPTEPENGFAHSAVRFSHLGLTPSLRLDLTSRFSSTNAADPHRNCGMTAQMLHQLCDIVVFGSNVSTFVALISLQTYSLKLNCVVLHVNMSLVCLSFASDVGFVARALSQESANIVMAK